MSIAYTCHMSLVYASTSLPKFVHITSLESSCQICVVLKLGKDVLNVILSPTFMCMMHLVYLIFFVIKHFKTFPNHREILIWNELGISSINSSLSHTSIKIQQYLKCQNYDDGNFHIFRGIKFVVVRGAFLGWEHQGTIFKEHEVIISSSFIIMTTQKDSKKKKSTTQNGKAKTSQKGG